MKKVLLATTGLVAAAFVTAAPASASDKIKLELGGYSKWWVVGAWQADNMGNVHYNSVSVKGDNQIFFGGDTTLDNGLKIGVNVVLEAGGNVETAANQSTTGDVIDQSYAWVESAYGKVILGTVANGVRQLHVMAPDAAGNTGTNGLFTGGYTIVNPGTNFARSTTEIDTDDNAEKITYVAPTFYGLTVGASYIPHLTEDNRNMVNLTGNFGGNSATIAGVTQGAGPFYGVGALYTRDIGPVGAKLSGGWVTGDGGRASKSWNEWSTGTQLTYGDFTLGGSYRRIYDNPSELQRAVAAPNGLGNATVNLGGYVWDAGLQYATGPYAVSFVYFHSTVNGFAATNNGVTDETDIYQASAKYTLGPGVDWNSTVGYETIKGTNTTNTQGNGLADAQNHGWALMTGLGLTF